MIAQLVSFYGWEDLGERITIPSLPDVQDLADAETARLKLGPNLSWKHPAARYKNI